MHCVSLRSSLPTNQSLPHIPRFVRASPVSHVARGFCLITTNVSLWNRFHMLCMRSSLDTERTTFGIKPSKSPTKQLVNCHQFHPHSETNMASPKSWKDYFDSPTLSDLTIRLSDRTVHAHRIVLCRGSEYFEKPLTGNFKVRRINVCNTIFACSD